MSKDCLFYGVRKKQKISIADKGCKPVNRDEDGGKVTFLTQDNLSEV